MLDLCFSVVTSELEHQYSAQRDEAQNVSCLDAKMMMIDVLSPHLRQPYSHQHNLIPSRRGITFRKGVPEIAEKVKTIHDVLLFNLNPHVMSWQAPGTQRYK